VAGVIHLGVLVAFIVGGVVACLYQFDKRLS
jgi:hypothetical protein